MAVYVNTNVSSLNGQRYLNNVQNSLNTTYQRLSSGLRINSAKDDSAGLQIADRLTSQINGLNQGNRNANDGIALAQTVEGGLDEISNMLQRMRTLAVQSANGTLGTNDRVSILNEADQLTAEITRIAEDTTFGGKTILAGYDANSASIYGANTTATVNGKTVTAAKMTLHVGANTGDTIDLKVFNFKFSKLAEAAGLAAETVTNGDPTWAGPLAGVQLGLTVYHVCEDEIKAEVDPAVYDEQVGMMEMVMDVPAIHEEMENMRKQYCKYL